MITSRHTSRGTNSRNSSTSRRQRNNRTNARQISTRVLNSRTSRSDHPLSVIDQHSRQTTDYKSYIAEVDIAPDSQAYQGDVSTAVSPISISDTPINSSRVDESKSPADTQTVTAHYYSPPSEHSNVLRAIQLPDPAIYDVHRTHLLVAHEKVPPQCYGKDTAFSRTLEYNVER